MHEKPVILLLSKGLARYRHNFTECLAAALPDDVRVIACPLGREFWEVDWPALKASTGRVEYRDFPRSFAELRSIAPSLVCTMEYPPAMLPPMFWATSRGIPVVVFSDLGKHPPHQHQIPWHTRLQHTLLAHFTDAQVAMAPAALIPHGAAWRPVHFAPHSIDTRQFLRALGASRTPNSRCVLLYVAGYAPHKGHDLLAKALRRILQDGPLDFELRLVGYGNPEWLQKVIQEHQLECHTVITGIKQGADLVAEYHQADLFVFPSRGDTYGVVAQEAATAGLPILISRHAGASHNLVVEGLNGHIIDPADTETFAHQLGSLMRQPERWPAMSAASRALGERHCVRRIAAETASWLLSMMPSA
jgi:glycosyltransferase involved in cell wall biosynthesis